MNKRRAVFALAVALAFHGGAASGQQPKPRRVGFLATRGRPELLDHDFYGEVPRGLKELGYVEGENLVIEWRFAGGDYERLVPLAAELAAIPVDVIVTDGTPGTLAAQKASATIPIVFAAAGDPVGDGLVRSLAHPGGRITGCALLLGDTVVKQMELLRSIVPGLSRVGVLWNPANPNSPKQFERLKTAAPKVGIKLLPLEARKPVEIDGAFRSMVAGRVDGVIVVVDSFLIERRKQIADLAAAARIPGTAGFREYTDAGGLMSYGINRRENYHRAAAYVDKILKGASPADLPVEQPTKVELVINKKTAAALGLTIPPDLLVLADKVIE